MMEVEEVEVRVEVVEEGEVEKSSVVVSRGFTPDLGAGKVYL